MYLLKYPGLFVLCLVGYVRLGLLRHHGPCWRARDCVTPADAWALMSPSRTQRPGGENLPLCRIVNVKDMKINMSNCSLPKFTKIALFLK